VSATWPKGTFLSVPGDLELAALELDVGVGGLHQVGGDLLALGDRSCRAPS
jgi:hypothetical protein